MTHPRHVHPAAHADLPVSLKTAIQELIARVGGEGFLMELQTDDGQRYYLAFGKPDTLREFVGTINEEPPEGGLPSIH